MKNVEKWSLRYAIVKPFFYLVYRLTYRYIFIEGLENIPVNKPVIIAPNHQNALMDALAIVMSLPSQPVFLSRADIFKNKIVASILYFFKLIPVFRIRDGKESLSKNQTTFDSSIRLLKKNKMLCLFPEAAHIGRKSMLPHKKAIPRISFLVGEKTNFEIDLYVVPVGINYSHYYDFRSDLFVRYGKPVGMKEYFDIYRHEGEIKATAALRERIFDELTRLCVHVPEKEDYDIYEQLFEIYWEKTCTFLGIKSQPENLVRAEQYIIKMLEPYLKESDERNKEILLVAKSYSRGKKELKLTERTLQKGKINFRNGLLNILILITLLPFATIGALLHCWLFWVSVYSFRGKIKDPQFYSSFSYVVMLIVFPLWVIILTAIFTFIIHNWLLSFFIVILSILCGIIGWEMWQLLLRLKNRFRFNRLERNGNANFKSLLDDRNYLVSMFEKILNQSGGIS